MPLFMSYCRLENTDQALKEAMSKLREDEDELSEDERDAKRRLIKRCRQVADEFADYDTE